MALDVVHLAQPPRSVNLCGLLVHNVADPLAAGLKNALVCLDRLHHGQPVGRVMRHRLLAVHILARGKGVQYHAAMLMVGHGHNHRVHILAIQ